MYIYCPKQFNGNRSASHFRISLTFAGESVQTHVAEILGFAPRVYDCFAPRLSTTVQCTCTKLSGLNERVAKFMTFLSGKRRKMLV